MKWRLECQSCQRAKCYGYGVCFACDEDECNHKPFINTVSTTAVPIGTKCLTDNVAIATVDCCINGGNSIVEDMYETAVYNRRIENNLPFPPDDKYFVGMLGLNGGFSRFTKK